MTARVCICIVCATVLFLGCGSEVTLSAKLDSAPEVKLEGLNAVLKLESALLDESGRNVLVKLNKVGEAGKSINITVAYTCGGEVVRTEKVSLAFEYISEWPYELTLPGRIDGAAVEEITLSTGK